MPITFRQASEHDFDYCKRLYFAELGWINRELGLNGVAQEAGFREYWNETQVRIILHEDIDIGWVQTFTTAQNDLFVGQLILDAPFQRRGVGTEVMQRLIAEANRAHQAVTLAVVKINPARRLYERLGFRVASQDDRKFYMKLSSEG